MLDLSNARLKNSFIKIRYKARCNYAHSVTLSSQKDGMTDDSASLSPGPDFLNRVNYTANVIWSNASVVMTTIGGSGPRTVTRANVPAANGNLDLDIDISGDNNDFTKPVVAGHYTDKITVSVGAPI